MTVPQNAPPPAPRPPTFMEMLSNAIVSGAAPDIIERLMNAHERWERNEARKAYDAALASARAKFKPILKTNTVNLGGGRGYKYEGQDDIERAIIDALSEEGLTYGYLSKIDEQDRKQIIVTCRLKHRDGHFEDTSLPGPIDNSMAKNPIQAIGSTTTYLARYTLRLALGLAPTEDDDGQAAERKRAPPAPAKNVMLHDPQTGEIQTAAPTAPGAADAAPGSDASPSSPGAATPVADLDMNEADEYLAAAAAKGMDALRAAWSELSNLQQQALKAALERRHKATALAAKKE